MFIRRSHTTASESNVVVLLQSLEDGRQAVHKNLRSEDEWYSGCRSGNKPPMRFILTFRVLWSKEAVDKDTPLLGNVEVEFTLCAIELSHISSPSPSLPQPQMDMRGVRSIDVQSKNDAASSKA
eukprot:scaffold297_cov106-Skeletonema_dohrnii-CCMP3373.AAC.3